MLDKQVFDVLFQAIRYVDAENIHGDNLSRQEIDDALYTLITYYKDPATKISMPVITTLRTALIMYDITAADRAFSKARAQAFDPYLGNEYLSRRNEEQAELQLAFDWVAVLQR